MVVSTKRIYVTGAAGFIQSQVAELTVNPCSHLRPRHNDGFAKILQEKRQGLCGNNAAKRPKSGRAE